MQNGGARWQTRERHGRSHREAGRAGGQARHWAPPRDPATRAEVALRWLLGEGTQAELAQAYGVALSTVRRWCAKLEADDTD